MSNQQSRDAFTPDAINLLRQVVLKWPAVYTDSPIEGADAVDYIGDLVRRAANMLHEQQGDDAPTAFRVTLHAIGDDYQVSDALADATVLVGRNDPELAIERVRGEMMEYDWDARLDASSCKPHFDVEALPVPEDPMMYDADEFAEHEPEPAQGLTPGM